MPKVRTRYFPIKFLWGPNRFGKADNHEFRIYTDSNANTKLHKFVREEFTDGVEGLIRNAPHPQVLNMRNISGATALHLAAYAGRPDYVRLLVVTGASPSIFDRRGYTPLHVAILEGQMDCIRALTMPISNEEIGNAFKKIDKERTPEWMNPSYADLEETTSDGDLGLHLATISGRCEVIRYMVKRCIDINARDMDRGVTALHMAIEDQNDEIVSFLLDCPDVNLEAQTFTGMTPFQYACLLEREDYQQALYRKGARPLAPSADMPRGKALGYPSADQNMYETDSGTECHSDSDESEYSDLEEE